jgi:hypothetical protein
MGILYTDTGSFLRAEVTGSMSITGSSNLLSIKGSGQNILVISGSNGSLLEIGESLTNSNDFFTIESGSINVFKIGQNKDLYMSGSLTVSGSITGSLFGTASFALSSAGGSTAVPGQIILSAAGGWPSVTSGSNPTTQTQTTTNLVNFQFLGFPDTIQTHANWAMAMPSDYNGGTITAVFYWVAGSASTNSVVWGLAGRAFADGDAIDQSFGTAQETTDANQSNDDVNISPATPAITLGGSPAASNFVQFRAYRNPANASDTLAATAELLAIRITYTRS